MFPFRKALKQSKYTSAILLSLCFINIYGADTEDRLPSIKSTSTVLAAYGIRGKLLDWIKSFLTNRQQKVVLNGASSEWSRVYSGVPQGSVLGPLLFNIYVNDIPSVVNSETLMFADDTKIFRKIQSQ